MNTSEQLKAETIKAVSPFEMAIIKIADPDSVELYREETVQEKSQRITKKFSDIARNLKTINK